MSESGINLPLEELPYVVHRLSLFQARDLISAKRQGDRTVELVLKWQAVAESLPKIRQSIGSTLEPVVGKGDSVTWKISNRPKFDAIKETIEANEKELASLESAIEELNSFAVSDYLVELYDRRTALGGSERKLRTALSAEAQVAISRHSGKSAEDALASDTRYNRRKTTFEAQTSTAKKALAAVNERIKRIDDILSSVGC